MYKKYACTTVNLVINHFKHSINPRTLFCYRLNRGLSGKEAICQCRRFKRFRFNCWAGKIPWRREWQPTPVFLPGESPWTEEPGGQQSRGSQRVRHYWAHMQIFKEEHNNVTEKNELFYILYLVYPLYLLCFHLFKEMLIISYKYCFPLNEKKGRRT